MERSANFVPVKEKKCSSASELTTFTDNEQAAHALWANRKTPRPRPWGQWSAVIVLSTLGDNLRVWN